jgi:hypothetical protein
MPRRSAQLFSRAADDKDMNTPLEMVHGYRIVQWTQHWSRIGGHWYRDAIAVNLVDGITYSVSFLDES